MGKADSIEAEFPPGIPLPPEPRKLCDYLDRTGYPISGSMRLRPEGKGLLARLATQKPPTSSLVSVQAQTVQSSPSGSMAAAIQVLRSLYSWAL